jgi:SAM-dependent methyltransferase
LDFCVTYPRTAARVPGGSASVAAAVCRACGAASSARPRWPARRARAILQGRAARFELEGCIEPNAYSELWFSTFLATIPPERTARELAFLRRQLPVDRFRRVLDIACGAGRHAHALGRAGYHVTGVDTAAAVLEAARARRTPNVSFVEADMRALPALGGEFDAAICLWQSFGGFDAETNRRVLRTVHDRLRPGGRFVLDIYNRRHFETRPATRRLEAAGRVVEERIVLSDRRLYVVLEYPGTRAADTFDWEVFTPAGIEAAAGAAGFALLASCCRWDETQPIGEHAPGMQLIFERARAGAAP